MNNLFDLNRVSNANYSSVSGRKSHKCQNCGLEFQSPYELLNHTQKFCINSGFDTLAGLNVKLKNPNHRTEKKQNRNLNDSLSNALEEIQKNKPFVSVEKQFRNDLGDYQRHKHDLGYARPYLYGSSKKNIQPYPSARKSRSLYMNSGEFKQKPYEPQKYNNSSIMREDENSKAYSFTSSHIRKFKQSKAYISPPSLMPKLQNAKHFSLLDRSDMSIKNMPEQEKREYVVRKILELEGIEQAYKKNGGKSQQFIENTIKMKKFYQDLLVDVNNKKDERFGKWSTGTRVSTPISKLDQLKQSNILEEMPGVTAKDQARDGMVKSRLGEFHQKSMAKRQDQIRKRFKTQFPQGSNYERPQNDILDHQVFDRMNNRDKNQNQIIVIPMQQPMHASQHVNNQQNTSKQTELTLKYLQKVAEMKEEQNHQYMNLLEKQNQEMKKMYEESLKNKEKQFSQNQNKIKSLEKNYNKLLQKMQKQKEKEHLLQQKIFNQQVPPHEYNKNFRISNSNPRKHLKTDYQFQAQQDKEYRELYPELDNVRVLNIEQSGQSLESVNNLLSPEEKILMQMQHEERDEYQLFSHLPQEIQQLKIESLKSAAEKKFEMEKEVLTQKLQKLKLIETMKHFQLERKLLTEELQNEKKKMQIHKLMKKKIKSMVKEQFENKTDNDDDSESDEQTQNQKDPFQFPRKKSSRISNQ